jgi:hypothetical protein
MERVIRTGQGFFAKQLRQALRQRLQAAFIALAKALSHAIEQQDALYIVNINQAQAQTLPPVIQGHSARVQFCGIG